MKSEKEAARNSEKMHQWNGQETFTGRRASEIINANIKIEAKRQNSRITAHQN